MAGDEMIFLKACPRCRGDIVLERDEYGRYTSCLACGYVGYPDAKNEIGRPINGASVQWFGEIGGFLAVEGVRERRGLMAASKWAAITS